MNGLLASLTPSTSISSIQQQPYNIPEKDEIWSSILKSVASSKMVPTKNVLILGEPGVGKSTLVHYLKNDPGPQQPKLETEEEAFNSNVTASNNYTQPSRQKEDKNDLALGYTFVDVQDEESEAIARLGLYQLGLSSPEFLPLLKFAVRSETIANSCVLIMLDWTRPWTFIETLTKWIHVLHYLTTEICKEGFAGSWSKGKAVVDELKEKLEQFLQGYTEPSNNIIMTASTSTSSIQTTSTSFPINNNANNISVDQQIMLPLPQGCLTDNLGIPIIVVCCKSDAINALEQTYDYKEDQFDFIQQTLRTICMKYGAALFYTSTLHPYTYHNLREYILHRVLTTSNKLYPFNLRAQVIERDTVLVPSGWDSWGKIKVLREGYDCDHVSEGFDQDLESLMDGQKTKQGTRAYYEESIVAVDKELPLDIPIATMCEDEQSFFERHYETLVKADSHHKQSSTGQDRPGIVGPLGHHTSAIDTMLRMEKKPSLEKITTTHVAAANLTQSPTTATTPQVPTSSPATTAAANNGIPAANAAAGAGPSHEVLANFFQSLLSKKASSSVNPPTPLNPGGQPNGRSEDPYNRRPAITRKDVHKELDRMRQYTTSK